MGKASGATRESVNNKGTQRKDGHEQDGDDGEGRWMGNWKFGMGCLRLPGLGKVQWPLSVTLRRLFCPWLLYGGAITGMVWYQPGNQW